MLTFKVLMVVALTSGKVLYIPQPSLDHCYAQEVKMPTYDVKWSMCAEI